MEKHKEYPPYHPGTIETLPVTSKKFLLWQHYSKKNFYNTEKDSNFGWPYSLPDKGYFYSNKNSYSEVSRVLNYLIRVKDPDIRMNS